MWFKKRAPVCCTICGKAIESHERRFVEKNRTTKIERHARVKCSSAERRTNTPDHKNQSTGV